MSKKDFIKLLNEKIIFLDGATGTNLVAAGMPAGVCPEEWIIENRQIMIDLQVEFLKAGTNIILAPTFTANRIKLSEYGLSEDIFRINSELVSITREAVETADRLGYTDKNNCYIAADISMTGKQLKPIGELDFEDLINVYKEQIKILYDSGVDIIFAETMMSLQETRAVVIAAKETCELPVFASLTYDKDQRTLYGTDPVTAVGVLQSLGADAVGANCSAGPDVMLSIVEKMATIAKIPIIAKPNAGLPQIDSVGNTYYDIGPDDFAALMVPIVEAGASVIGGCCGTTPMHIAKLKQIIKEKQLSRKDLSCNKELSYLSSERKTVFINTDSNFLIVGERINPTGKKALQKELLEENYNLVHQFAIEQETNGASLLDINVGMGGIDEKKAMLATINEVSMTTQLPLVIDSSNIDVIEAALRYYPGRALVNSVSLEKHKIKGLLPIIKQYGAMFILLPLDDKGLPENFSEKKEIILKILLNSDLLFIPRCDIIIDGLVTTVGANSKAAIETLEVINYCKNELSLPTICGLSNISFGLPERININSAFLCMAIREGLTMAIMNPSQKQLVLSALSTDMLLNKKNSDITYIEYVNDVDNNSSVSDAVYKAVLSGDKRAAIDSTKQSFAEGVKAIDILNNSLMPAINEVGHLFETGKFFLPQLIKSAEAMKLSVDYLSPYLKDSQTDGKRAIIVIATVKGDIHDIGKNLVALMLRNYGHEVIDLGKDVPSSVIIETAREKNADVIGLSALMTTTMSEMKEVIRLARIEGLKAKIIIGGAVTTQEYANLIGADGYSKDAQDAVKLVERLLNTN